MSTPTPDRRALEELWLNRLKDAKLRLDFTRNYTQEVQRDFPACDIPESDHNFAKRSALRGECFALAEYNRVLRIYSDLTVRGITPDETEWLKSRAANAALSKGDHYMTASGTAASP